MYFSKEIFEIEKLLEDLEQYGAESDQEDVSKMQIYVQAYLPGLISRICSADRELIIDIKLIDKDFNRSLDFNGPTYFKKSPEIRLVATQIRSLIINIQNIAQAFFRD